MSALESSSTGLLTLVAALLGGCCSSPDCPAAGIDGSLSVVMDLGWDQAVLDTTSDEIAVRFIRNRTTTGADAGVGGDTPFKITYAQAGQALNTPATLVLEEARPDDPTRQRTIISRNVLDDPRRVFPELRRGLLIFFDKIVPDSNLRGQFNITFVDGVGFANGRTAYASFTARVPP